MSCVFAFDIAVVAQKVKGHVVIEDRCDLKSGVGPAGWVTDRSGWL